MKKDSQFLWKSVELAIKEMKNGKATGVDGIPIDIS